MNGNFDSGIKAVRCVVLALLSALAVGCATVTPSAENDRLAANDSQQSRADRVFLYQSRIADALLDRYPLIEIFEQADPAIIAAEARMTEACNPLTRAVLAHLEGEKPSLGLRLKVFTSLDRCERAARHIDHLLNKDGQKRALAGSI